MKLSDEGRELVKKFYTDHFDALDFRQPLVCRAINQTAVMVTLWRTRGYIHIGVEKNGRVHYTGRGLVHAGLLSELTFVTTPERAARFSEDLRNEISRFQEAVLRGEEPWTQDRFLSFIAPPIDDPAEAPDDRIFMTMIDGGRIGDEIKAMHRAKSFVPFDRLMVGWAVAAMMGK